MRDALRRVPLFSDLPDADLELLAAGAVEETVPAGTVVFREGDQGDRACVIVDGEVEVVKASGPNEMLLAIRHPGDVVGEMSLLDAAPRMATVRAKTDVTLLTIPKRQMDDLVANSATASRALFAVLLERWRETDARLRQSERMAQIGTLTAGLAHEMNNPAAAVQRGAGQLRIALDQLRSAYGELQAHGLDPRSDDRLGRLLAAAQQQPEAMSALARSDREMELEAAIADFGLEDAWRLVPALAAVGVQRDDLEAALGGRSPLEAVLVVRAFGATADAAALVSQIETGATRLAAIVGALKSYSYLDQAEMQEVDLRQGLDDTLLILNHKLSGIGIRREYPDEPLVLQAYAAELNQVWTNLIDNAADALTTAATADPLLTVRIASVEAGAAIEVEDNGPGIPEEIVDRIFDAFFTTKEPGKGTGLGLEVSYGIVVHRHGGEISVDSVPGRTTFRVVLPHSTAT
ncbi:MAG: cyclic nucleotide-binding domain-containing protein [Acidimicrobiia bacterium]|nr:cyclic nucleotide-binding domain-containing protein [Acidimicrobiia bacterium]